MDIVSAKNEIADENGCGIEASRVGYWRTKENGCGPKAAPLEGQSDPMN